MAFTDPAYGALHRAIGAAGGASSGLAGTAYLEAISQHCSHASVRSVMTELAVEPLAVKQDDEFRYVSMVIARLQEVQVGKQIEDVKSRLRRLSPIKDADEYRALWGDLVALEEYRKALLQQSAGVL